jgi:hypothetical protein
MIRGHLNRGVPKLSAAGENAVSFDDGIAKELSQFVNFLSRTDPIDRQPLGENHPMRLAAVALICRALPRQRGINQKTILS